MVRIMQGACVQSQRVLQEKKIDPSSEPESRQTTRKRVSRAPGFIVDQARKSIQVHAQVIFLFRLSALYSVRFSTGRSIKELV